MPRPGHNDSTGGPGANPSKTFQSTAKEVPVETPVASAWLMDQQSCSHSAVEHEGSYILYLLYIYIIYDIYYIYIII